MPNAKTSDCDQTASYSRYSWEQIYAFPDELALQSMLPWPRHCITNYSFNISSSSKPLWFNSFDFYSSLNGAYSGLPCAYFELTVTQMDESDNLISKIHDYVAIQFVFDLPTPYAPHTIVHNVDSILTLSIYDFFQFSDLVMSDEWIDDVYKMDWQCLIFDENLNA